MSEQTINENQTVSIESPIDSPIDSQAEVVKDAGDVQYLSPELITGGQARNIVTVRLKTQTGSFCVDVLKQNPLYRLMTSEYQEELININEDEENNRKRATLAVLTSYEILVENIVKPQLSLKDDTLYLGEDIVPGDTIDLLLQAYDKVNNQRATAEAVQHFQSDNGSETG